MFEWVLVTSFLEKLLITAVVLLINFQPVAMSEISPGTSVIQPNGLPAQQTQKDQDPVVSFSPEGVNPGVNIISPGNVVLEDQSSVIT